MLAPGSSSLSVESGLYRAPAHPYDAPPTDFLLLRSPVSCRAAMRPARAAVHGLLHLPGLRGL